MDVQEVKKKLLEVAAENLDKLTMDEPAAWNLRVSAFFECIRCYETLRRTETG